MVYQLSFSDRALKSLKRIPKSDNGRIIAALEKLAKDPDSKANVKRLNSHPDAIFRLRVSNYRFCITGTIQRALLQLLTLDTERIFTNDT